MKAYKIFLVLISAILLNGCFNKSENLNDSTPPQENKTKSIPMSTGTVSNKESFSLKNVTNVTIEEPKLIMTDRMIIKHGTINIEIEKYSESEKKIMDEVNKVKGFVTNSTSSLDASGKEQGTIEVRIPSANYDPFISSIQGIGKVMSQNISGSDVTEEYIDLEARQKTQKELEKRLLELLSEKTAKLVDVVEVEEKLSSVREIIESTEGRMKFLKDQSAFSTLNISLFEPSLLQTSSGGGFFYEISQAFKKGLNGFTEVLAGLITFIVAFLPVLIFIMAILFLIKKLLIDRKKRKAELNIQST